MSVVMTGDGFILGGASMMHDDGSETKRDYIQDLDHHDRLLQSYCSRHTVLRLPWHREAAGMDRACYDRFSGTS
jgi:hypothetical protein